MSRIYICYRRDDTAGHAGWLCHLLRRDFEHGQVFMDIDSIAFGDDFVEVIKQQIAQVDAVVVLIGPRWLDAKDQQSERRIDNPNDFVRLEIVTALDRKIRIIPALVQGAKMPREADLPDNLKPLSRRQAIQLNHASFERDAAHLASALKVALGQAGEITAEPSPSLNDLSWNEPSGDRLESPDLSQITEHEKQWDTSPHGASRHEGRGGVRADVLLERRIGGSTLTLERGDITNVRSDAIVSSDDVDLSMGGGVSGAIRRVGGEQVWRAAQLLAPLELGGVGVTTAGNLPAQAIFHAAVLDYRRRSKTAESVIRDVTRRCLQEATSRGYRSIAFPTLATGTAGMAPEQSATAMMLEITEYLGRERVELAVTIVLYAHVGVGSERSHRYYDRVMDVLTLSERMNALHAAAEDLQAEFGRMGERDSQQQTASLLANFDQRRGTWEQAFIQTSPENATVGDNGVRSLMNEIDEDLSRLTSLSQAKRDGSPQARHDLGIDPSTQRSKRAALNEVLAIRRRGLMEVEATVQMPATTEQEQRLAWEREEIDRIELALRAL